MLSSEGIPLIAAAAVAVLGVVVVVAIFSERVYCSRKETMDMGAVIIIMFSP